MTNRPKYDVAIPADVRFCYRIPPGARLLYGDIAEVCDSNEIAFGDQSAYCEMSNEDLQFIYQVGYATIRTWLNHLQDEGFIRIAYSDAVKGYARRIFVK